MGPQKSLVEQGFTKSASGSGVQQLQCSGKPVFGVGSMKNHGNKKSELDSVVNS